MANIELVIKIPEEIYNHTQEYEVGGFNQENDAKLFIAIKNSTPLPKGHGRLIDADMLWDLYHDNDYDFYEALDDVQTIIKADSEKE